MHRRIVYIDQNPLDVDQLEQNKHVMIGFGMAMRAILGVSTLVDGLACTPTGPASLQVLVGQGSIYSFQNVDGTTYGSIAADTTHQIVKQGINLGTLTLSCPAPGTTGQSINYLIQTAYQDADTGATVLPYFNSSNPDVAYNGPNNTGVSQNTVREGQCLVAVKAGIAATTGTQTTPAPDAGYTGIWVVTVANGQTTITSGNISVAPSAPFISEKLGDKVSIPTGDARWMPIGGTGRTRLIANTTYNVATTGNDTTGDGSSGNPWATRQKAWTYLLNNIDLNGFSVKIKLSDGTYTDNFNPQGWMVGQNGSAQIVFEGNTSTPSNVLINPTAGPCFPSSICGYTVQYLKQQNSTSDCVQANQGGFINLGAGLVYGTCAGVHIRCASTSAYIGILNSYTISGNAAAHWQVQSTGGLIGISGGITITLSGTPAFSSAFAVAVNNANIFLNPTVPVFSGSATGSYYSVALNGVINTQGQGASYFPGNSAGSTLTGGQYS